jgi:hypothetical protein
MCILKLLFVIKSNNFILVNIVSSKFINGEWFMTPFLIPGAHIPQGSRIIA